MIYKQFKDLKLSSLGFGAMRLPSTGSGYGAPIDYVKAAELIEYAYKNGINYFDTSYFYHDGDSERFLGKTLASFPRESWYLASKLPGNLMRYNDGKLEVSGKVFSGPEEVFNFQMERCAVDYFDFFLLHNLAESTYDIYTNEDLGIIDCLLEQKARGRIRHLGFSSHGRPGTIDNFLNYLAGRKCRDFEFAMIQMNYLDWTLQEAGKKHEVLNRHGLATFVMEPLRGGKLARLGGEAEALLKASRPNDTLAAWAFRFLQSIEDIPVVLSGMSSLEHLKENLALFSRHDPLTEEESRILQKVLESITDLVPCTSCRYCVEYCPQGLDIPMLLTLYNEASFDMAWFLNAAIRTLKDEEKPGACTSCRSCVPLCPQNIDIPKELEEFDKKIKSK